MHLFAGASSELSNTWLGRVVGTRMLGEVACGFSSPHFHYIRYMYSTYVSIVESNVDQRYLLPVRLCC